MPSYAVGVTLISISQKNYGDLYQEVIKEDIMQNTSTNTSFYLCLFQSFMSVAYL